MEIYKLKNTMTAEQAESLKGKFLEDNSFDILINNDADGYDMWGNLLFRLNY